MTKTIKIEDGADVLETINESLMYLRGTDIRYGSLVAQDLRNLLEMLKAKLEAKGGALD